ncbi:MAG TPA: 4-(cytidine 5'-diphospho)-2-C-methyl-D-erythritol kinase [Phenylobacterium sp.]|jgi:4-diphosphocytidyl-2-C-methyl-D-erythritol kinase|uniref:4-(cytidine 5'-diphospho)-2-C-methyl-D-erythritol kinase n=1 Tax=Phenylobacterium sp. TaxID=1871053 RepID=UPI002D5A76A2|nr:4-(cytidine 5'-diphospho)-2-C-methyl-D-erythritol kinase [Phenylobacterium sp.]HZZ69207.1 4-(cytidine 5'-diphospho)-2-C-methyl-D-erythritol kinase [Phenylobacterium sp.]
MSRSALAPAKVNLFLHVGAPGGDGYHPICSLMAFADVGDLVSTFDAEALVLRVAGPFARELAGEGDNLILRAARALIAEARRPVAPVGLSLEKRLPVASGLGGGSSDAGAALRLLREVLGLEIDNAALEALAAGLGADGPACLWGAPAIAQGRGERLSPAPGLPPLDAVLVRPPVPVSTAQVYRAFDAAGRFGEVAPPTMPDAFEDARDLAAWLGGQRNDLQAPAIAVAPEVGVVLDTLADEPETLLARVSGSGGTCFALCAGDIEAEGLAERIEAMAPDWWVQRCRLGGPWPDPA